MNWFAAGIVLALILAFLVFLVFLLWKEKHQADAEVKRTEEIADALRQQRDVAEPGSVSDAVARMRDWKK